MVDPARSFSERLEPSRARIVERLVEVIGSLSQPLDAGTSRFLRKFEHRSADEVDPAVVSGFLAQALERLPIFKATWRTIGTATTQAGG